MSDDERAIRTVIETWLSATRDGDVATVLSLMAPDVVFLTAGQPPMVGRDAFERGMRQWMADLCIESASRIEEIVVSGDMAYCRTHLTITMTSRQGKAPMQRSGPTLSILRKRADGKWLLTRDANMLGAPA